MIVRTIYTAAESKRRADEENILEGHFQTMEKNIDKWIDKSAGVKSLNGEVLQRTKGYKASLEIAKKHLEGLEEKDLDHSKQVLKNAQQRKKDFEDGKAKAFHKLESPEEAVKIVQEATALLKEVEEKIDKEKEKISSLTKMVKKGRKAKEEHAIQVRTEGIRRRRQILSFFRK